MTAALIMLGYAATLAWFGAAPLARLTAAGINARLGLAVWFAAMSSALGIGRRRGGVPGQDRRQWLAEVRGDDLPVGHRRSVPASALPQRDLRGLGRGRVRARGADPDHARLAVRPQRARRPAARERARAGGQDHRASASAKPGLRRCPRRWCSIPRSPPCTACPGVRPRSCSPPGRWRCSMSRSCSRCWRTSTRTSPGGITCWSRWARRRGPASPAFRSSPGERTRSRGWRRCGPMTSRPGAAAASRCCRPWWRWGPASRWPRRRPRWRRPAAAVTARVGRLLDPPSGASRACHGLALAAVLLALADRVSVLTSHASCVLICRSGYRGPVTVVYDCRIRS